MPNQTKRLKQANLAIDVAEKKDLATQRDVKKGTFLLGNQYAVKYPPKVAESLFQRMYDKLIEDEGTSEPNHDNPTRANSMKLVKEVCLCVGICYHIYQRLKNIYATMRDLNGDINPVFNEAVFILSKKIEEICENRLAYSGTIMDLFLLKNHYGYVDKMELVLSDSQSVTFFTLPDGTKLPI